MAYSNISVCRWKTVVVLFLQAPATSYFHGVKMKTKTYFELPDESAGQQCERIDGSFK